MSSLPLLGYAPAVLAQYNDCLMEDGYGRGGTSLYGETSTNLHCLSPPGSPLSETGAFVLKPTAVFDDRSTLNLQFFWQSGREREWPGHLDLLTALPSTRNLDSANDSLLFSNKKRIRLGQTFTMVTYQPRLCPLLASSCGRCNGFAVGYHITKQRAKVW